MMQRDVRAEDAGKTIIQIVHAWLHPSKKMLASLKWNKGRILCNGVPVRTDHVPHPGDRISVILEDMPHVTTDPNNHTTDTQNTAFYISEDVSYPTVQSPQSLVTQPHDQTRKIKILYEDRHIIILDKPAGIAVHPCPGHPRSKTLLAALEQNSKVPPLCYRVVGRLDIDTGGCMMYAKTRYAADIYSRFRKSGTLFKCYLALLHGHLTTKQGILCTTLSPAQHGHIMRPVTPLAPDARLCRTAFHVLAQSTNGTLIAARPLTGRMHQIRAQFAAAGHALIGDTLYGAPPCRILPHQALHATEMTFPRLSEQVDLDTVITARVHSPLPRQFQTLLRQRIPPTQFSLSHPDEPDVYACLSAPQTLCEMTHL